FSDKSDSRIDFVLDANASTARLGDCVTNFLRVDFDDETRARGFYLKRLVCQRQNSFRLVTNARADSIDDSIFASTSIRAASSIDKSSTGFVPSLTSPRSNFMPSRPSTEFPTASPSG